MTLEAFIQSVTQDVFSTRENSYKHWANYKTLPDDFECPNQVKLRHAKLREFRLIIARTTIH